MMPLAEGHVFALMPMMRANTNWSIWMMVKYFFHHRYFRTLPPKAAEILGRNLFQNLLTILIQWWSVWLKNVLKVWDMCLWVLYKSTKQLYTSLHLRLKIKFAGLWLCSFKYSSVEWCAVVHNLWYNHFNLRGKLKLPITRHFFKVSTMSS